MGVFEISKINSIDQSIRFVVVVKESDVDDE